MLKDSSWTQVCYYVCLVKTIGGFIVRLIECCIMNENPEDDECENISDSCTGILTDLLLLVVSIALMINHDVCAKIKQHIQMFSGLSTSMAGYLYFSQCIT